MRAVLYHGERDVRVETVPEPVLTEPTDALVRVTLSCICGSDLWPYRRTTPPDEPSRIGHEFLGVVEQVGADVRTLRVGDLVIAPFKYSCGECEFCLRGLQTSCLHGGFYGTPAEAGGGQGEMVRVPYADGTLVAAPVGVDDPRLPALLTLSDVMATGHHAAVGAGVGPGSHVAVIGDGAVGLCGVLAARRLGAERITLLSSHPDRAAIGRSFGATDVVEVRGDAAVEQVRAATGGLGVPHVMECVGMQGSWDTALGIVKDGGRIGYVGVPNGVSEGLALGRIFRRNVTIAGGVAPARAYLPELMADVLDGSLDPSPVFDLTLPLDQAPEGYAAMDERRAIKVLLRV